MRFIRKFEELDGRQRLYVGIVNGLIAVALIFIIDRSLGIPVEVSAVNIAALFVVGSVFMLCYRTLVKIHEERKKS